jgi:hypothetical protein
MWSCHKQLPVSSDFLNAQAAWSSPADCSGELYQHLSQSENRLRRQNRQALILSDMNKNKVFLLT